MDTLSLQQEKDAEQLVNAVLGQNQITLTEAEFFQVVELFSQEWKDVIPESEYEARIVELAHTVTDGQSDL